MLPADLLPENLAAEYRRKADLLEAYAPAAATAFREAADLAEAAWIFFQGEHLTLSEAAEESGYSEAHLSRLLSEGKIPNAGRKNRPRVRRGDLPKKVAQTSGPSVASRRRAAGISALK